VVELLDDPHVKVHCWFCPPLQARWRGVNYISIKLECSLKLEFSKFTTKNIKTHEMMHFHSPPLQNNFDDGSLIIALAQYLPEKIGFVYEQGAKQGQKRIFLRLNQMRRAGKTL